MDRVNKIRPIMSGFNEPVIPAVFDESLSYMEMVAKIRHKVNETVVGFNEMVDTVNKAIDEIEAQKTIIEGYDSRLTSVEDSVAGFNEQIENIEERMTSVETNMASVNEQVGELDEKLDNAIGDVNELKSIVEDIGELTNSIVELIGSMPVDICTGASYVDGDIVLETGTVERLSDCVMNISNCLSEVIDIINTYFKGGGTCVKTLLEYKNGSIVKYGTTDVVTFEMLNSMLLEGNDFVVLVNENRAYHPNVVSTEQIVFISNYVSNGYLSTHRISINHNDVITMTQGESEKSSSRVNAITNGDKSSTSKYPSVKAVVDYVDNNLLYLDGNTITHLGENISYSELEELCLNYNMFLHYNGVYYHCSNIYIQSPKVITFASSNGIFQNIINVYAGESGTYIIRTDEVELEYVEHKVQSITESDETDYPSTKAVIDYVGTEFSKNMVNSFSGSGSATQFPTTKAVVDYSKITNATVSITNKHTTINSTNIRCYRNGNLLYLTGNFVTKDIVPTGTELFRITIPFAELINTISIANCLVDDPQEDDALVNNLTAKYSSSTKISIYSNDTHQITEDRTVYFSLIFPCNF